MVINYLVVDEMVIISKLFDYNCMFSKGCKPIVTEPPQKKRGLSPKIISEDSRRSENAQTHTNKHTIPNMKFKLKLL
jgi:hypothetical protein